MINLGVGLMDHLMAYLKVGMACIVTEDYTVIAPTMVTVAGTAAQESFIIPTLFQHIIIMHTLLHIIMADGLADGGKMLMMTIKCKSFSFFCSYTIPTFFSVKDYHHYK